MAYRLPYVQPLVSSRLPCKLSGLLTLVGCTPVTPDASRTLRVYLWVSYGVSLGILGCISGYLMVYLWVSYGVSLGILWCISGCVVVVVVVSSFDISVSFGFLYRSLLVSSIGLFWFPLSVSFRSSSCV